jgi:putative membrane protein insertion efficiency factor
MDRAYHWTQLPQRALMALVRGYRLLLSPWLGSSCRFEPTCSVYSFEALQRHGAAAGTYLTAARIVRCHPWCDGGFDPVPARAPSLFRRFVADDGVPVPPLSDKTSP